MLAPVRTELDKGGRAKDERGRSHGAEVAIETRNGLDNMIH
jgi:hypothetical protein